MRLCLLLAALVAGCGDDLRTAAAPSADAGARAADGGVIRADAADETLAIAGSAPADGDIGVPRLASPWVTFTADLDATSVHTGSVQLWWLDGPLQRVHGSLSYDSDSRTITFRPHEALARNGRFELRLAGICGANGQMLDANIRFHTLINPFVGDRNFDDEGTMVGHTESDTDALGRVIRWRTYRGADDTDMTSWSEYEYDRSGHITESTLYTDPGDDTEWFTEDDVVVSAVQLGYDGDYVVQQDRYSADGTRVGVDRWDRDSQGRVTLSVRFTGPGVDGVWFTTDDRAEDPRGWTYDPDGRVLARYRVARGDDLLWGTEDDLISGEVTVREYRSDGLHLRTVGFRSPGLDGEWLTGDDEIGGHVTTDYADGPARMREVGYGTRGLDGAWFTEDDGISTYDAYTNAAKNLATVEWDETRAGGDGIWYTGDDYPQHVYESTYAETGALQELRNLNQGADGVWWNDDDYVDQVLRYDPSR